MVDSNCKMRWLYDCSKEPKCAIPYVDCHYLKFKAKSLSAIAFRAVSSNWRLLDKSLFVMSKFTTGAVHHSSAGF